MILGDIENIIFHVSTALRVPVEVLALSALTLVIVELGALSVELWRRRGRSEARIAEAGEGAREALAANNPELATTWVEGIASNGAMSATLDSLVAHANDGQLSTNRMAKTLADYDLNSMRRLERTRMLVRAGPALGLMGTLIPLSPALTGLANGHIRQLTDNLRVAFSVTVLGLIIGAFAFAISLVRDRIYAQDLSDMQAIAAELEPQGTELRAEAHQDSLPGQTEVELA